MPLEQTYKDSRILVTGGGGFIGSHLCERLLAEGAEVISVGAMTIAYFKHSLELS